MDHFGIGSAMRALVTVYEQASRKSGRTTSLVDSVKSGDRIVFTDQEEARRVRRMCKERGLDVNCVVVPIHETKLLYGTAPSEGRTIFDHRWVEEYYRAAIERAGKDIDEMETQYSGYGAAHRETLHKAQEIRKWMRFGG